MVNNRKASAQSRLKRMEETELLVKKAEKLRREMSESQIVEVASVQQKEEDLVGSQGGSPGSALSMRVGYVDVTD